MTYLLDANVFMSASRLHYGFDFCPAFWEWLVESNSAGLVFSIEKVQGEIQAGADELADWSDERGQEFFLRPDEEVLTTLTKVSAWCTSISRRWNAYRHTLRACARVGNIYVNRDMVGAVVGVQPFGGMGLSGTGPKAGGPHYLHRFAVEKTITVNTTAKGGNVELLRSIGA